MLKGDKIYVEDLRVKATIGIFDWEKKIKQEVSISYEIPHDNKKAAAADAIEATTDYKSITKAIIAFVESNKFELVETFAERIAEMVIKDFNIAEIRLRVSKNKIMIRFSLCHDLSLIKAFASSSRPNMNNAPI